MQKFPRSVTSITVAATLLRLALVQFRNFGFPPGWGGEMVAIASALADGRGFSDAYGPNTGLTAQAPPAYPFLLSLIFRVLGGSTVEAGEIALYLNALLSAGITLLVFRLAEKLFDRRVGILAAALWAFWPLVGHTEARYTWNTSLYALLFTVLVRVGLTLQPGSTRRWVAYWLLAGITVLVDTSAVVFVFLFAGWQLVFHERRPLRWLVAALVLLAVVAPWMFRNWLVFGRPVLRSNLGLELSRGISDEDFARTDYKIRLPNRDPEELARYRRLGEIAYMDDRFEQVRQYVSANPVAYVRRAARRFVAYWAGNAEVDYVYWPAGRLVLFKHVLYVLPALCALGGLFVLRRSSAVVLLAGVLTLCPLVYYFTYTSVRYRAPLEPLLAALAAGFLSVVWTRLSEAWGVARGPRPSSPAS